MRDIPPRFSVMFKIVRVDNSVYPPVSTVDALCKTFSLAALVISSVGRLRLVFLHELCAII